jgi:hypothetical protein
MATTALGAPEKAQPRETSGETSEELQTGVLPLEERIRQRAHGIWLQRNGRGGSAMEDWLQAEEEVRLETK